jgi:hypothetical protein
MRYHKLSGFALFEVLFTVSLVSFCILSLGTLQIATIKLAYDNYFTFIAHSLINDLTEKIAAHPRNKKFTIACSKITDCLEKQDITAWQQSIKTQLPQGGGNLIKEGDHYLIEINWHTGSSPNKLHRYF